MAIWTPELASIELTPTSAKQYVKLLDAVTCLGVVRQALVGNRLQASDLMEGGEFGQPGIHVDESTWFEPTLTTFPDSISNVGDFDIVRHFTLATLYRHGKARIDISVTGDELGTYVESSVYDVEYEQDTHGDIITYHVPYEYDLYQLLDPAKSFELTAFAVTAKRAFNAVAPMLSQVVDN